MELLFKNSNFSQDMEELIGQIDADIQFDSMKSDIITSTKEVIKLIGQPMYDHVVTLSEATSLELELEYHVKYPIALNAFRLSLPTSDLMHTQNGRVMRSDDHEKAPFEWMIERDDRNWERKYYRALDDLLNFLDTENLFDWKASEAFKKQKSFFVNSTEDFDEFFPINSRLLLLKLLPGIRKAERDHVRAVIGKEKYNQLKTAHQNDDIPEEDQELFALIKEACVYFSLAWGMKRLTATLFPEGVLQQYTSEKMLNPKKSPEQLQSQLAHQEFHNDALSIMKEIEVLVTPQEENETNDTDPYDFGFESDDKFATT